MPLLKLQCADKCVIKVDSEVAKVSGTIKAMVDDMGLDRVEDEPIIPLNNVNSRELKKVIEWATHHKDDPPRPRENNDHREKRSDDISIWDGKFLEGWDQSEVFQLMFAARALDLPDLYDLTAKTIANIIKYKTPEEIRVAFGIQNDLTPEQEDEMANWCM